MGTNYYLESKPPCGECHRRYERQHIGKSSSGWCFALHVDPANGVHGLQDWMRLWDEPGAEIVDEYERPVSRYEMLQVIAIRSGRNSTTTVKLGPDWTASHLAINHAEPGPNGLVRSRIDGRHCIGHGNGTWDLIIGEFS